MFIIEVIVRGGIVLDYITWREKCFCPFHHPSIRRGQNIKNRKLLNVMESSTTPPPPETYN